MNMYIYMTNILIWDWNGSIEQTINGQYVSIISHTFHGLNPMIDGLNLTKEYHSGSTIDEIYGSETRGHWGLDLFLYIQGALYPLTYLNTT
jgi:hypothetical protein